MEQVADGRQLLVFLVAAGIVVPLFQHLKLGVVMGFLIAGIIVGPGGFGHLVPLNSLFGYATITSVDQLQAFGDLGILFLLFTIGLELSFERVGAIGRLMLGAGGLQVALVTAAIYGAGALAGFEFDDSLVFGMAFALSSTAIVTQSLAERRRLGTPTGRTALGVLILQDLMVVPIVIIVGILAQEGASVGLSLVKGIALAVVVVVAVVLLGRTIVKPLMRFAGATGNRTLLISITLLIIVVAAAITARAGLSAALGAFLAGLLLSETEYRHQIDVEVEPFKDLLLGLFFMTVGMTIDVVAVFGQLPLILGALAMLFAVKLAFGYVAFRIARMPRPGAIETAFVLGGAGEFAFVVFTLAARDNVIAPDIARLATTIAALSMVLSPLLGMVGEKLAARLRARDALASQGATGQENFSDHVIIGGFGRFGATVATLLAAEGIPHVALDLNSEHVRRAAKEGHAIFFGDATRPEILARLGADKARAFVVTLDEAGVAERMVQTIREHWPNAIIHARARSVTHARRLLDYGATDVVPEALEGSLQLAGNLLADIGLPDEAVEQRLAVAREVARARMRDQTSPVADGQGTPIDG
ncbi:Kef-type potassium/proton antiporter, CPA2 family (TC 2.A.37.1) [Kaistia soli DSM 19436]|uniref:Kef-type potassium/proton antiporter, CPA2 family (TC 2.A.37.1) n=1 Tax=Kaistia soli DSM 19436 TaxID=1122133 RepID=A0A1M5A9Q7_9HYPH|nr:cation:proton antiporter [Kaistia soli]SHF27033.1 Kef-type potassium/proton antiporter, CPA2 family (TC 2.A.37.1) [Kaistia soli DSM 19436]